MAEKEFRTGDEELLVVTEGDTVGFITRGHDREDLSYDEVWKLIEFLQDIVGHDLTVAQLDAMEPDDEVADRDGDIWTRDSHGDWNCSSLWRDYTASEVVNTYGPVRKVG